MNRGPICRFKSKAVVVYCGLVKGSPYAFLHVADFVRLFQSHERIALRHELLPHIAVIVRLRDSPRGGQVVQLLILIQFMPSRHASSVDMTDLVDMGLQCSNDIPLHGLHRQNKEPTWGSLIGQLL